MRHQHAAYRLQSKSDGEVDSGIEPPHRHNGDAAQKTADAAKRQYSANQGIRESAQALKQRRQQRQGDKGQRAKDDGEAQAEREIAVEKELGRQERLVGGEAVGQENIERHRGQKGLQHDLRRIIPALPFAPVDDQLQTRNRRRQRQKTDPVHAAARHALVIGDEDPNQKTRYDADRQDHVKRPAPVIGLGDISPDCRPENGAAHNAHAPDRGGEIALVHRKGAQNDRLGQGHDGSAEQAL